ncbi:MAG: site-2 protease family protein [Patescibacteria group bacterium]
MLLNILLNGSENFVFNLVVFLLVALALVVSISIHEFAHAYIADKLGDPTARYMGRVTLNPKAHLDPMGTVLLLLAGFGWGKPVPFNPIHLKNPKRDAALISFAGPASNFILATLLAIVLKLLPNVPFFFLAESFLFLTIFYNLVLGIFNLIPVHPLDGFKIVNGLLPNELSIQWMQMAPYGIFILLLLIFTRTTSLIIDPLLSFSLKILGVDY